MPAISIDTFFACSLMVLLVLSAMAVTAKISSPMIEGAFDAEASGRYREIAEHMLLSSGKPPNWGKDSQTIPEAFGLAEAETYNSYELDIDKVSRMNGENLYALSYAQIFGSLGISDTAFGLEIEPFFDTNVSLLNVFAGVNETTYEFEISTSKSGTHVSTTLKHYIIAGDFLATSSLQYSDGVKRLNATLPNDVDGPALIVVFAVSSFNSKIASFGICPFAHNSHEPAQKGTFLGLSPLNYSLTVSTVYPETVLHEAYALTFNYSSKLTQTTSTTFRIPKLLDSSPTVLVVTGWNSTEFFTEWTVYPQIPLQIGTALKDSLSLSNVFVYSYPVTVGSAIYKCTIWLGGPRQ